MALRTRAPDKFRHRVTKTAAHESRGRATNQACSQAIFLHLMQIILLRRVFAESFSASHHTQKHTKTLVKRMF
jgi:hypothetical protein